MVPALPINNYNNEHYKQYQQHSTPPPQPPLQPPHQQQMSIPMPVPVINHHLLHPHHQHPNFYHPPPPPPPPPLQPMYPVDQTNGQYMDYPAAAGNGGFYPSMMGYMQQGPCPAAIRVCVPILKIDWPVPISYLLRSPVLYERIMEDQQKPITLDLYILHETFYLIIQHLFTPLTQQQILYFATEKPNIAIELLEASEELGLQQLLDALLLALKQNLHSQKIAMAYIHTMNPFQPLEEEEPRRWVEALEEDVVSFMVDLSNRLEAFSTSVKVSGNVVIGQVNACGYMPSRTPPMCGFMDLARAYSCLPRHLMIRCLEHPALPVQDTIQRHLFAGKVLTIVNSSNTFHQRPSEPKLIAVMKFEKGVDTIAVVKETGLKKGCWNPKLYDLHAV